MIRENSLSDDIGWALRRSLAVSCVYSLYVAIAAIVAHSSRVSEQRLNAVAVIVVYQVSGVVAGIALGALRPLARAGWGRAVIGMTAGIPLALGGGYLYYGSPASWTGDVWFGVLFLVAFVSLAAAARD